MLGLGVPCVCVCVCVAAVWLLCGCCVAAVWVRPVWVCVCVCVRAKALAFIWSIYLSGLILFNFKTLKLLRFEKHAPKTRTRPGCIFEVRSTLSRGCGFEVWVF